MDDYLLFILSLISIPILDNLGAFYFNTIFIHWNIFIIKKILILSKIHILLLIYYCFAIFLSFYHYKRLPL